MGKQFLKSTKELKQEIEKLITVQGKPGKEVMNDIDLNNSLIYQGSKSLKDMV